MEGEHVAIQELTISVSCHSRHSDVIVRPAIRNENHDLSFVGFGFAEQLLWGIADGCSRAGPTTPVTDPFNSTQDILLRAVLVKAELEPLLIGVLNSSDAGVSVRNLKLFADVCYKLQDCAEIVGANAAGAVDYKTNVSWIEARLAANQPLSVT